MDEFIRVFIVDDNRLLRDGLVAMLAEQENIIGAAASNRKAVEQIKDLRPEVALIDIGMPAKDGIEVTQTLRMTHWSKPYERSTAVNRSARRG